MPEFTTTQTVRLRVNGQDVERQVEVRRLLADFLRHDLGLTATHLGCEHGVCGACTVMLNGNSVRACLLLAVQADGGEVMTLEGLADGEQLHPLQQAFWDHHALQCGFCTSGFLMSAYDLLAKTRSRAKRKSATACRATCVAAPAMPISSRRSRPQPRDSPLQNKPQTPPPRRRGGRPMPSPDPPNRPHWLTSSTGGPSATTARLCNAC